MVSELTKDISSTDNHHSTMEPHRRHDAATDSCCCSGIHAGRRLRASSGANSAQFGTSPARTRFAMSIAFGQCAHPLRRQAHCQGLARTRWTVRPQSVPNRASGKNRDKFPDLDNLRPWTMGAEARTEKLLVDIDDGGSSDAVG